MKVTRLNVNGIAIPITFKDRKLLLEYLNERIKSAENHKEHYLNIDIMNTEIPDDVAPEDEEQAVMNALKERKAKIDAEIATTDQLSQEFGKEM